MKRVSTISVCQEGAWYMTQALDRDVASQSESADAAFSGSATSIWGGNRTVVRQTHFTVPASTRYASAASDRYKQSEPAYVASGARGSRTNLRGARALNVPPRQVRRRRPKTTRGDG